MSSYLLGRIIGNCERDGEMGESDPDQGGEIDE